LALLMPVPLSTAKKKKEILCKPVFSAVKFHGLATSSIPHFLLLSVKPFIFSKLEFHEVKNVFCDE